jgi:hypothetical protein
VAQGRGLQFVQDRKGREKVAHAGVEVGQVLICCKADTPFKGAPSLFVCLSVGRSVGRTRRPEVCAAVRTLRVASTSEPLQVQGVEFCAHAPILSVFVSVCLPARPPVRPSVHLSVCPKLCSSGSLCAVAPKPAARQAAMCSSACLIGLPPSFVQRC